MECWINNCTIKLMLVTHREKEWLTKDAKVLTDNFWSDAIRWSIGKICFCCCFYEHLETTGGKETAYSLCTNVCCYWEVRFID